MKHTPLFFAERDGPWYPTLRLLHQYPEMMKKLRVDKGALKFVMSGANIMCPGLTSPGATIHDEVSPSVVVCTHVEGRAVSYGINLLLNFSSTLQHQLQAAAYTMCSEVLLSACCITREDKHAF